MAKSISRHSKPVRKPVTIDLDPSQVKRVEEPGAAKPSAAAKEVPPAEPVGDFAAKPKAAVGQEEMAAEKTKKTSGPGAAAAAPAQPKPAANQSAWLTHIAAGVAGGVIALGAMSALRGTIENNPDTEIRLQLHQTKATAEQALQQAQSLSSDIDSLKTEVAKPANNGVLAEELQSLTSRIAALEGKVDTAAQTAQSASQDTQGIAELQSKLAALETQVTEQSRQPAIASAIAAVALKSAIDRGGSFATELDAYASVAPQSSDLEALKRYAETGVPTIADLNSRFDAVADRIVATERDVSPNAGVVDQLIASAKSLVKVRPVGEVSGDSIGAITARMETALHRGDLTQAIAEWETLPADAKAVSTDFADAMKARRDTDALVARTLAAALKPTAATPAAPAAPAANPEAN
jgi:hypothetical protein